MSRPAESPLPGVEGTIEYVSNPFINVKSPSNLVNFNNLVVATGTAEGYNLYIFDNLTGGVPQAEVEPLRGTGTVKSVRYLYGGKISFADMMNTTILNFGAIMPWTD